MALRQAKANNQLGPKKWAESRASGTLGMVRRMDWEGVLYKRMKAKYKRARRHGRGS